MPEEATEHVPLARRGRKRKAPSDGFELMDRVPEVVLVTDPSGSSQDASS